MPRLLIVSNRLPISVEKRAGELHFEPSITGLVTGLKPLHKRHSSIWIGWPGIEQEEIEGEEKEFEKRLSSKGYHPVFLSRQNVEGFYHGFCNKTVWPLFHYFPLYTEYDEDLWHTYERVNEVFGNTVLEIAKSDDIIWIHDYQLMLLPKLIRERLPQATVGFFLHIPFPSYEIFRLLPWRQQILDGLLGADLIGFHTDDYVRHFLESVQRLLGYETAMNQITTPNRIVRVDAFPLGIDYQQYNNALGGKKVQAEVHQLHKKLGNRKVILSIDRLDYSKGIPQRLEAFSLFLKKYPEHKGKLILILVLAPSRLKVEHYILLKKQIDELVGSINGQYGTIDWTPIWYLNRSLPFHSLIALHNIADIALVTPIRDGMNLVAKEYIATRTDGRGVLVLSETAGAAQELGEAIIINVNSQEEIVQALKVALEMPEEEQIQRNRTMQKRLQTYDVARWSAEFMDNLLSTTKLHGG